MEAIYHQNTFIWSWRRHLLQWILLFYFSDFSYPPLISNSLTVSHSPLSVFILFIWVSVRSRPVEEPAMKTHALAHNILDLGLRVRLRRMCISFSVIRGHTPILIGKGREWLPLMFSFMPFLKRIHLFLCIGVLSVRLSGYTIFSYCPHKPEKWHWISWNCSNRLWAKCSCWKLNLGPLSLSTLTVLPKCSLQPLTLPLKAFYCNVKRLSKGMTSKCDQDSYSFFNCDPV